MVGSLFLFEQEKTATKHLNFIAVSFITHCVLIEYESKSYKSM